MIEHKCSNLRKAPGSQERDDLPQITAVGRVLHDLASWCEVSLHPPTVAWARGQARTVIFVTDV